MLRMKVHAINAALRSCADLIGSAVVSAEVVDLLTILMGPCTGSG
jgi:hypothetical protein